MGDREGAQARRGLQECVPRLNSRDRGMYTCKVTLDGKTRAGRAGDREDVHARQRLQRMGDQAGS